MNKEQAKKVIQKVLDKHFKSDEEYISLNDTEFLQALDIAIESLDNEWRTDTPKESGYYLVTNGANELDIRKWDNGWYHDMYRRYTNEELKIIAWKKIEPYERKE